MIDEGWLASIDNALELGESPEEFDILGSAWVYLVSKNEDEDETAIVLSYLIPRAYGILEDSGWEFVANEDGGIALP